MSDNVGLTTPRGSGTSGYVQRNMSHLRPRPAHFSSQQQQQSPNGQPQNGHSQLQQSQAQRKPDQGVLAHERKRAIEARVFALRCELEDAAAAAEDAASDGQHKEAAEGEPLDEDAIEEKCAALRAELIAASAAVGEGEGGEGEGGRRKGYKSHQVHEMAAAKIMESERLRKALGIREDYTEGDGRNITGYGRRRDAEARAAVATADGEQMQQRQRGGITDAGESERVHKRPRRES